MISSTFRKPRYAVLTLFLTLSSSLGTLLPTRTSHADTEDALGPIPDGTAGPADLSEPAPLPDSPEGLASIDVATGAARTAHDFVLPRARGAVKPSLRLQYHSNEGLGVAGMGWSLVLPSITRKGTSGHPRFDTTSITSPSTLPSDLDTDDYTIDGKLLIPVAVLDAAGQVVGGNVLPGERFPALPANASPGTWTYFRSELDDGRRYFFDGASWIVQTKDGQVLEFGIPAGQFGVPGQFAPPSVEFADEETATNLGGTASAYRWNLVRQRDASGNTIYFAWDDQHQLFGPSAETSGRQYLTDIYYTLKPGAAPGPSAFAHHVHLTWRLAQYPNGLPGGAAPANIPYATSPIWRAPPTVELAFVNVTSATWSSTQRQLLRSYAFNYIDNSTETRRYLSSIRETGDCRTSAGPATWPVVEDANGSVRSALGATGNGCKSLQPTTYTYYGIIGARPFSALLNKRQVPAYSYTGGFEKARLIDLDGDAVADLVRDENLVEYGANGRLHSFSHAELGTKAKSAFSNGVAGDWSAASRISMFNIPSKVFPFIFESGFFSDPNSSGIVNLEASGLSIADSLKVAAVGNEPGRTFDIDGDSLTDATFLPANAVNGVPQYSTVLTSRNRSGATRPFLKITQPHCVGGTEYDPRAFDFILSGNPQVITFATRSIADVDGDGVSDVMVSNSVPNTPHFFGLRILPGHGDGRFGVKSPNPAAGCSDDYGKSIQTTQVELLIGHNLMQDSTIRFGDLTGDGFDDFALLNENGVSVCVRHGANWDAARWFCTSDSSMTDEVGDIQIADIDGTGIKQLVFLPKDTESTGEQSAIAMDIETLPNKDGRVGLLNTIMNPGGARTTLTYRNANAIEHDSGTQAHPGFVPVPVWVVTKINTANRLVGTEDTTLERSYLYNDGVYDPRDRLFTGFRTVQEVRSGGFAPSALTTTTFASVPNTPGLVDTSSFRATRNLPFVVQRNQLDQSSPGVPPSGFNYTTVWHEYQLQKPYVGMDNRKVAMRSSFRDHNYVWSDNQAVSAVVLATPFSSNNVQPPKALPVPATEIRTLRSVDSFGNEHSVVDYGVVGTDRTTLKRVTWDLPPGDTTGWSFRPQQVKSGFTNDEGLTFADTVRQTDLLYTPQGLLADTFAVLSGALSLPGPQGGRTAGQPRDASQNGTVHLKHIAYDAFGNVQSETTGFGANQTLRCTTTGMDPLYATFPALVTEFPAGCNTGPGHVTSLQFDRAHGVPSSTLSPDGRLTLRKYEDFGRLAEIDQPNATVLGATSVSLKSLYDDAVLVQRVYTQTATGSDQNPTFVDHYAYRDGLGDEIMRIDQAGSAATGTQWIVSGMHSRYTSGQVNRIGKAAYVAASAFVGGAGPAGVPLGGLPLFGFPGPTESYGYDGFGRELTRTTFDGTVSTQVHHSLLSTEVRDAEQATGQHQSAFTSTLRDGFGRVLLTKQTVANSSHGAGTVTNSIVYNAFGEPETVSQTFPGAPAPIMRSIQYDTLGRVVQNQEPNAGTWTYAYNDSGELVGTADARGCGQNIFHDALGRVVAQDYSPCDPAQPAYTTPDPSTGAETFYLYDSRPGMLTASWDPAQHSVFAYDARGRVTSVQRRLAAPTLAGTPAPAGSGLTISGTIVDAQGNPMSGLTVTLSGGLQATTQTSVNGVYVFSNLVSGRNYSVQPSSPANCTLRASTVANLNSLTSSQTASFMGTGSGCGGNPQSTPIPPMGNLTISGVVTAPDGKGAQGIEIDLNGAFQAITHTDASGFYSFKGLASGSGKNYSLNIANVPSGCSISPTAVNNITASTTRNFSATGTCPVGIPATGASLSARYAPHVFQRVFAYDAANREISATSGADIPQLAVNGSQVSATYLAQGIVDTVNSSYGALVPDQRVNAAGRVTQRTYGDVAATKATIWYDNGERLLGHVLARTAGPFNGAWTSYTQGGAPTASSGTLQTVLSNGVITRDKVGNPLTITQSTTTGTNPNGVPIPAIVPSQWPNGTKPATLRSFTYGDDYRLEDTQTQYAGASGANDSFVSPYTTGERNASTYPALATVSTNNRVRRQQYTYDWRGNIKTSSDDANVFFDRSLGTITNGTAGQSGPDRLFSATLGTSSSQAQYDAAGNVTRVTDTLTGAVYAYTWDELGRLASASRTDGGSTQPNVVEQCTYDTQGQRVRTSRQTRVNGAAVVDHTIEVFDSLVLKNAAFPVGVGDYERNAKTVQAYLRAGGALLGHVFYDDQAVLPVASGGNGRVHVYMPLGDHLGSTTFVVDRDSSELVERPSYLAYGGVDSDHRPTRWRSFREDVRFTGHWDHSGVGLTYFGARFYSPALGRFLSPDPLVVHAAAGSGVVATLINGGASRGAPTGLGGGSPYAYCDGNPIACKDSQGLKGEFAGNINVSKLEAILQERQALVEAQGYNVPTLQQYDAVGNLSIAAAEAGANALGLGIGDKRYFYDSDPGKSFGVHTSGDKAGQQGVGDRAFDGSTREFLIGLILSGVMQSQMQNGRYADDPYDPMNNAEAIYHISVNGRRLGLTEDEIDEYKNKWKEQIKFFSSSELDADFRPDFAQPAVPQNVGDRVPQAVDPENPNNYYDPYGNYYRDPYTTGQPTP